MMVVGDLYARYTKVRFDAFAPLSVLPSAFRFPSAVAFLDKYTQDLTLQFRLWKFGL